MIIYVYVLYKNKSYKTNSQKFSQTTRYKNGDNLERALKTLKSKVIKTKQNQKLNERKEYTKKSVVRRAQILKAKYIQSKNNN